MEKSPDQFRVIAVSTKAFASAGPAIEQAMNQLHAEGYQRIHLRDRPGGMLIIGSPTAREPAALAERPHPAAHAPADSFFTPRSMALLNQFIQRASRESGDPWAVSSEAARHCVAGFTMPELQAAAREFEQGAAEHEATHDGDASCTIPSYLRAVARAVRDCVRLSLQ